MKRLSFIPKPVWDAWVAVCAVATRVGTATIAVACLVAVPGIAVAQQQPGSGPAAGTAHEHTVLRGTVVNSVTHQPVGRAVVRTQDGRFATMTDDRGRFELVFKEKKNPPPANGAPGATGARSFSSIQTTTSSDGTTTTTTTPSLWSQDGARDRPDFLTAYRVGFINMVFHGQPGVAISRDQEEVTIPIIPEARVIGHVTLADGEGARGMQVSLYRRRQQGARVSWQASGQAEVKSDGEFRMADLEAGDYKLFSLELNDRDPVASNPRGQLFGYPPDYYPSATDFAGGALIHLSAGETFQVSLTPERHRYYPVRINVVNRQNGVVPQVEVWKDGHSGPGFSLGFDFRDGSIGGSLPDGNYVVSVTGGNENVLTGLTTLSVNGAPAAGAVTLMGGTVVDVEVNEQFSNAEQNTLQSVDVPQPGGDPSAGRRRRIIPAQVMLWSANEFSFRQELRAQPPSDPDADGLEIANVPAGEYRPHVYTPVGYVASIRCGGTDLMKSNLVVAAGTTQPPIEVVLRDDGGEVDGTVTEIANRHEANPQGAAIAAAYVYFIPEGEGEELKQTFAQRNGEFQMAQLPPGTYQVVAFERSKNDLEWSNQEEMKKFETQTVTIAAGQKEKIRISLNAE